MRYDFDKDAKRQKRRKLIFKILIWVVEVFAAIFLAYFIANVALEKATVLGNSMSTALEADDKILINKMAYLRSGPDRYDVIVFKQTGKEHSYYNIKRVIGLPGETVEIKDGYVYINGKILDEPMLVEPIHIAGLAEEPIVLDEDEYFVLGDNRNNSEDSRFANIGNVVKSDIIGKAWIRTNEFGFISKLNMSYDSKEDAETMTEDQTEESK